MVYNELCHKEIDWSKAMKQILITLVAVVLGSTAMSSYAEDDYKLRVSDNPDNVFSKGNEDGVPVKWRAKEKDKVFPRTPRTAEEHTKTHRKAPKK